MAQSKTTTSTVQMEDGVNLYVKLIESEPNSQKPLLIAHHGAPGLSTHAEPEAAFSFLSDTFRVLVFDARGSGASDMTGPYTHDRWIKDIENLRKWAGAETFVLAGGSYGGFIALDYAILHSNKLRGLILRDTWANGVKGMMTALASCLTDKRLKVDAARQVRVWSGTLRDDRDFEDAVQEILPVYAPPENPDTKRESEPRVFEGLGKEDYRAGRSAYNSKTQNAAFSVNMPRFDVRHRLGEIKVPTLVVVGRHDLITPVEFSEEIASGIPNAKLEIFEHSGHTPPSDEPEKFRKIALDFLRAQVL